MAIGPSYRRRALPLDLPHAGLVKMTCVACVRPVDDLNASEHTAGAAWEFARIGDRHSCAKRNPLADALIRVSFKIQCHRRAASQLENGWVADRAALAVDEAQPHRARKVGIGRWYHALMRTVGNLLLQVCRPVHDDVDLLALGCFR